MTIEEIEKNLEFNNNMDAFDTICGDCAGVDMAKITEADIRAQADIHNADEDMIQAAIKGLSEYLE